MIKAITLFVNKIISFGGFKRTDFSNRSYNQLLTAFEQISEQDVVIISSLVNKYKHVKCDLLIDTTDNPKYGLGHIALKLKNLSNGGYRKGFKIVLFLCRSKYHIIPIGFALLHKESKKQEELVLTALRRLRYRYKFKPNLTIADAGFSTQELMKRLNNYGWGFVMKGKKNYSLDKKQIKRHIKRGYGTTTGVLRNGVKVKVVRRPKRVFVSNRVSLTDKDILAAYNKRWKIEETFRELKSCIGLDRCQQHTVRAQAIYIWGCLLLYSIVERLKEGSMYKAFQEVFLGEIILDEQVVKECLGM